MRSIREIAKHFACRRLGCWLGLSEPVKYAFESGRIFQISGPRRRRIYVASEIHSWNRLRKEKAVRVLLGDSTSIVGDGSDELGSLLERELPELWNIDDETD